MVVWAIWTAALRPLSGESVFEMLERAGNYGVPLAMLLMCWPRTRREWFAAATPRAVAPDLQRALRTALVATTALLMLGHGALGVRGTPTLMSHYAALGFSSGSSAIAAPLIGWVELAIVVVLLLRPSVAMGLALVAWKLATESLWLVAGAPAWEFVERSGSYAAPLALALLVGSRRGSTIAARLPAMRVVAIIAILGTAIPATAFGQAHDSLAWRSRINQLDDRSLLTALRAGGLVLVCRHAITVDGARDQRNLSEEGRRQAIAIGRAVRAARIGTCPVLSSPIFRARETAELAFGDTAVVISELLRGEPAMSELMPLFTQSPPEGQNRVLITHQGTLYRVLTMFRRPEIREGDCVVLRPNDEAGTFEVVAKLSLADWERLAKH
jgi:phosphohistidine phosphatase SixA